jgi:putative addiction module component (TIGR02574 family)
MTPSVETLKEQLGLLSQEIRAELAAFLLESLDPPGAGGAWQLELERRMEEMESGEEVGVPAEEVFANLRKKLS